MLAYFYENAISQISNKNFLTYHKHSQVHFLTGTLKHHVSTNFAHFWNISDPETLYQMYYEINEVEVQLNKSEGTSLHSWLKKFPSICPNFNFPLNHRVWKSPKKSDPTLRAKRAKFTF